MKKSKKGYGVDEVNMIENYILLLTNYLEDDNVEMETDERKKEEDNIKGLNMWIKELKTTGETHKNLKWKVDVLTEIYNAEKNAEIIDPDEEDLEIQKEILGGIKAWLDDLKKAYKHEKTT